MRHGFFQKRFPLRRRKQFFAWQIEITTRCPLSCRMCIRQGLSEWASADMSLNNFEKLIPYFHDVGTIILQGWGEPLLHNDLCAMMRAAKGGTGSSRGSRRHAEAASPSVGFVTSGKGLTGDYSAELIDAGIDFIGFSFAGSTAKTHEGIRLNSDFQELVHAVAVFNELKKKRGLPELRTHIVYLMLKDNLHDIPLLPRLARDIGIQEVVLTNVIHVTNSWQDAQRIFTCDGRDDTGEILNAAEDEARKLGVHLRRPALSPIETSVCAENPLTNLYISSAGEVSPCVFLHPPTSTEFTRIFCGQRHQADQISFGNIFTEPFIDIWNQADYVAFRDIFARRVRQYQEGFSPLFFINTRWAGVPDTLLPEPPLPCRTCHKMLGV
jgi:MoaA/NifB/PqqE/SkfB family radical SAM enzyme